MGATDVATIIEQVELLLAEEILSERVEAAVQKLLNVVEALSADKKSLADEVVKASKHAGYQPLGVEGEREAEWVLVDLGDVVVHVMLPRVREFYALERLWTVGDQPPEA